jgi:cell wall-associated NlpC family hydrolase
MCVGRVLGVGHVLGHGLHKGARRNDGRQNHPNRGEQYLGTKYSEMNCSEFTSIVYERATSERVVMPASDDKQRWYGRAVEPPERGDLVYFKENKGENKGEDPVTHVGIYYGHDQILHSSEHFEEVVISEMGDIHGYLGARHIRADNGRDGQGGGRGGKTGNPGKGND